MQMQDYTGQIIKGYELVEFVARGGFGAVYRAYQAQVSREVAIKIILPEFANDPDFIRRFEAEAHVVARLEHPHIIPLYDYWRDAEGAYLVMRWLRGGSLRDLIKKGVWDAYAASHLLDQVAQALYVAHINGVIHRDIKPDNILFDEHNNSYLADFGIAKDTQIDTGSSADMLLGSPAYLTPEQIRSQDVAPQADIYSLGLVMYEILAGIHPFADRDPARLLFRHLNDPIPTLLERRPDLPESLDSVLQRATAKEPDDRYKTVIDFAIAFKDSLADGVDTPPSNLEISDIDPLATMRENTSKSITMSNILNPYKGLRAFQEADSQDFFGREKLVTQLVNRLKEDHDLYRFLAIVGPSGSGKSSVVKAGVVPAIRNGAIHNSDNWFVVEMFPSNQPFEELQAALLRIAINPPDDMVARLMKNETGLNRLVQELLPPDQETELLLVIDQFEELFTQVEDEAVREHFLISLQEAVTNPLSRLRLIITLRADFYDRPLYYPEFADMFRQRTEVILPMGKEELQRAIVGPAERVNITMEQGLVPAILRDVAEQPGALPLLQYALTELFDRREGRLLTSKAYRESGGVLGALARRADELYKRLSPSQQEATKQLFLRMVTLGEGTEDTRRRVRQSELMTLLDEDVLNPVINTFGQFRLLTFDRDPSTREPTIEVAHEALIQRWSALQDWIDENRENLRTQRRLTNASNDWYESNEDASFLASGARLAQFELWSQQSNLALSEEEQEYLHASIRERERKEREEQERHQQEIDLQRRAAQRLRYLVAVFLIAAIGASILSAFALNQRAEAESARATSDANAQLAEEQAEIAGMNAQTARSLELVANARQRQFDDPNMAINLALEATQNDNPPEEAQSILAEVAYAPGAYKRLFANSGELNSIAISPAGTHAITSSTNGKLIVWDIKTGQLIQTFIGHQESVVEVAYSPDGTMAASGSERSELFIWNMADGALLSKIEDVRGRVSGIVWLDDKSLASVSSNRDIILWDIGTGKKLHELEGHTGQINRLAITSDGTLLYSASDDNTIIEWDLKTYTALRRFRGHSASVTDVALTADGTRMVTSSLDQTIIMWDLTTGTIMTRLQEHSAGVLSVAINRNATRILSGSADQTVILWNFKTGQVLNVLHGHDDRIRDVAFSLDNQHALSTSSDGSMIIWDIIGGNIEYIYPRRSTNIWAIDIYPDGDKGLMATGSPDNDILTFDTATGTITKKLSGHKDAVTNVIYNEDGTKALSTSSDRSIILWDLVNDDIAQQFRGHTGSVWQAVFSADETQILSGSSDKTMILWDVASGKAIQHFEGGHINGINTVYLKKDNQLALSGSADGTIVVWNVEDGSIIRSYKEHTGSIRYITMNQAETQVLSTSTDDSIHLWDINTGKTIQIFRGHSDSVEKADFIFDETRIISASLDHNLILWNIDTGKSLSVFHGQPDRIWDFEVMPDSTDILSASREGTLIRWRTDTLAQLQEWVQTNRYVSELSCEDRNLYRIDPLCEEKLPE